MRMLKKAGQSAALAVYNINDQADMYCKRIFWILLAWDRLGNASHFKEIDNCSDIFNTRLTKAYAMVPLSVHSYLAE